MYAFYDSSGQHWMYTAIPECTAKSSVEKNIQDDGEEINGTYKYISFNTQKNL